MTDLEMLLAGSIAVKRRDDAIKAALPEICKERDSCCAAAAQAAKEGRLASAGYLRTDADKWTEIVAGLEAAMMPVELVAVVEEIRRIANHPHHENIVRNLRVMEAR